MAYRGLTDPYGIQSRFESSRSSPSGLGVSLGGATLKPGVVSGMPGFKLKGTYKKGGAVKKAKGGSVSSASKRADGCATKGKTKGRFV